MRIAIIRLSAFGDVVISASMLAGFKKVFHQCEIEWFIDERFSGIMLDSPCITKLHALPFKKLLKSIKGILFIRKYCKDCGSYDMVIDMQGLLKSALVGKFLHTKNFIGFSKNGARESLASLFYTKEVDIAYDSNILERNYAVLFYHTQKSTNTPTSLHDVLKLRSKSLGINTQEVYVNLNAQLQKNEKKYTFIFVLEASIPEKMYPIKQYAILAQLLHNLLTHCHFYVLWNDYENLANDFLSLLENEGLQASKLPKLDFNMLKFCLMKTDCVIGGDTGVTHLAWAVDTACITLYGNTQTTSGKNMRQTHLNRVLLGNPYLATQNDSFEIASIKPIDILKVFEKQILPSLKTSKDGENNPNPNDPPQE